MGGPIGEINYTIVYFVDYNCTSVFCLLRQVLLHLSRHVYDVYAKYESIIQTPIFGMGDYP